METGGRYLNWDEPTDLACQRGALTIGNFDGVHVGHQALLAELGAGDVRLAAELLGRTYSLAGYVRKGAQRGQTLGFPTANLHELRTLVPGNGVYAVRVHVGPATLLGAANIGPNPTFGDDARK